MTDIAPPPYPGLADSFNGPSASLNGSPSDFNGTSYPPPSAHTPQSLPNVGQQCEENQRLTSTIRETEGAVDSFAKQDEYVKDLQNQLSQPSKAHAGLRQLRQRKEYEFRKIADSKVKKSLMSMTVLSKDKFDRKKEKEEQEFIAAKKAEDDSNGQIASIQSMIDEAMKLHVDLESQSQRYIAAQDQLDALHRPIFDGHTPEAPEEDRLEWALNQRRATFEQKTYYKHREETVMRSLKDADMKLQQALSFINPALNYSDMDRWGNDSAGYTKRDLMHKVEMNYQSAKQSVDIARLSNPSVGDLAPVAMPKTRIGDIYFDNIVSDSNYHYEIKATAAQLQKCKEKLQPQMDQAHQRIQQVTAQYAQEKALLDSARRALQEERSRVFEYVLNTRFVQQ